MPLCQLWEPKCHLVESEYGSPIKALAGQPSHPLGILTNLARAGVVIALQEVGGMVRTQLSPPETSLYGLLISETACRPGEGMPSRAPMVPRCRSWLTAALCAGTGRHSAPRVPFAAAQHRSGMAPQAPLEIRGGTMNTLEAGGR